MPPVTGRESGASLAAAAKPAPSAQAALQTTPDSPPVQEAMLQASAVASSSDDSVAISEVSHCCAFSAVIPTRLLLPANCTKSGLSRDV